jgi:hypothetical protein
MVIQVLLLDNSFGPWNQLYQNGALKTWCNTTQSEFHIHAYRCRVPKFENSSKFANRLLISRYGRHLWRPINSILARKRPKTQEQDHVIQVDLPELWSSIAIKTISALEYVDSNYDYDYILRANASCYINFPALLKTIAKSTEVINYGGPVISSKKFVSGWGILLSKEAVQILIEAQWNMWYADFDDEVIGKILSKSGINPIAIPYYEIRDVSDILNIDPQSLKETAFFRLKAMRNFQRIDSELMLALHQVLDNGT